MLLFIPWGKDCQLEIIPLVFGTNVSLFILICEKNLSVNDRQSKAPPYIGIDLH
jgi:hypothetical protein